MDKKSSDAGSLYSEAMSLDEGRPVSELKVDLHVYVVPPELWREHLQSAVNQVINDTVSAGFIRVMPDATVQSLREDIETQIGFDLIPREFVFLKCVGRCFTRIKSKQERLLKVKNFIPPQAYAPEMFILELTPDIRAMPNSGSTSVQSQTSPQSGYYSAEGKISGRIPPIKSNTIAVQTGGDYSPDEAMTSFDDWERYEEMGSDAQGHWLPSESLNIQDLNSKSTQTRVVGNVDLNVHKKPSQNRPAAGGRIPKEDQGRMEGYDPPLSATPTHSPEVPVNLTRARSMQTLSEKEMLELEELMRREREEEKRKAEEAEKMERERLKQEAMDRRRKEEEQKRKREEQKRLQELEEAEKRKQREEQKRLEEEKQRKLEEKRLEEEKRKEMERIEKQKREEAEKRKKEEEERKKREEEERRKREEEERERKKREEEVKEKERRKREEEEKKRRKREEEEERVREEEALRKELERKEKEERRRKEEEQKRKEQQRKLEEEKQKKKMLEQQKANEKANLLKEIEELKAARLAMERKHDELTKKAKQLKSTGKAPPIKHNARDNWKKKYFEEKKKTAPLDEHCNRLKRHLESVHKRVLANLESAVPTPVNSQQNKLHKEANNGSLHLRAKQLEHDVEEIQQRLEGIKMKLTGEMKLRNQAERDTRLLRSELAQRKLHRNLPDGYRLTARSQALAASKS